MIDFLPEDVINLIFNNLEDKEYKTNEKTKIVFCSIDINFVLSLKNINRFFKTFIEKQKNLWINVDKDINIRPYIISESRSRQIENLCLKKTPSSVFKWLFDNNIQLSVKNIQKLIIKNRIDVILLGFHYEQFLKTVFNKFTLCSSDDIFGLSENSSIMVTAIQYNRLNIVKILIESSLNGNPYLNQIENIFEETIKYTNTSVLNYLIVNHYEKLKKKINERFNTIILRFNNIEDILFYIVVNNKASITRIIINSLISKNYIELFKYCYKKKGFDKLKNNSDLLKKCIESNAFVIFDYLMESGSYINPYEFSKVFLSRKIHNTIFFNMIIDKYLDLIPKNNNLITLSIKNKIDFKRITRLINNNYHYDENDIISVIEDKNIQLAKIMINSYKG